jgi:hypothetical protein
MNDNIKKLLFLLGEEYKERISGKARNYIEVDLGDKAQSLGFNDLKDKLHGTNAVIPLKHPAKGMKVRIDGRTFVNYGQFDSGITVPGYMAKKSGLPYKTFFPNDSMILNFS